MQNKEETEEQRFAKDLKDEGWKQTGLLPGEGRGKRTNAGGAADGAMVGGKFYTNEELQRVKEILAGILNYCKLKQAGLVGSKGRRKALKESLGKDGMDQDLLHSGEYVNPLTAHQAQRQEIEQYWNRFSMISIEKKKNIQKGGKQLELDADQVEFQKKLLGGPSGKEKRDALDLQIHNEYQAMLADQGKSTGIEKELRVINAQGKIQIIQLDTLRQIYEDEALRKLNNWEKTITPEMDKEEREKVILHNKKLEHTNLNPFLCLKTAVSKDKKRTKADGYDLDLTYITNYVVALGYPADGIQASIRNKREDVISFFKGRHGVNVKIYNLCIEKSKRYSQEDIPEFGYQMYPFCDHQICSIKQIFDICLDIFLFLQGMIKIKNDIITCLAGHYHGNQCRPDELETIDKDFLKPPVVAIHCKAGKGRTGLIICCFLLFTEMFGTAQEAIDHYDRTRVKSGQALTIPSQIRQVYFFKHFLDRVCVGKASKGSKRNYILNALKNFKQVGDELDMMEKCEEYQYKNSLNIFSITLGPFETMNKGEIQLDKIEEDLANVNQPKIKKDDGAGGFGGIEALKDPNRKADNSQSKANDSEGSESQLELEKDKEEYVHPLDISEDGNGGNDEFINQINEQEALKLEISKLRPGGDIEPIWKLEDYIEYNKDKTNQVIKVIHRKTKPFSAREQYVVILLEKILEEFTEPHFGYLHIKITLEKMNIGGDKLQVDDTIKFYFWINVAGICTGVNQQNGKVSDVLSNYSEVLVKAPPKSVNGFKLMNDEREMLQLILPKIENIGEIEYKNKVRERQLELAEKAKEERRKAEAAAAGGQELEEEEEQKEEAPAENKKLDFGALKANLKKAAKATVKTEKANQEIKKGKLAKLTLLNSLCGVVNEFYSEANNLQVPDEYNQLEKNPFDPPSRIINPILKYPTHKLEEDQDVDPNQTEEGWRPPEFNYHEQLSDLWGKLGQKVIEKMSDSRRVHCDDLRLLQGRQRQFYKIQLQKEHLDKFEPGKEVKVKKIKKDNKEQDKKKGKKNIGLPEEKDKRNKRLTNFNMTILMYEDQNA